MLASHLNGRRWARRVWPLLCAGWALLGCAGGAAAQSFASVVLETQPKMVKVYGAGGVRGLEAYQSGFLISPEGHVLTSWSTVLDTEFITAVLDDGRKFTAQLLGQDPRLEIAVLKIDAKDLPFFDLDAAATLVPGDRVLAFSNLFGVAAGNEPASVLHGAVAAKTQLSARRGAFASAYKGPVYVLDAMTNNPGAAGGALTDRRGRLAGLLGKELRSALDNTYLNYALPIDALRAAVLDIRNGVIRPRSEESASSPRPAEPLSLGQLGLVLVPDVLPKTPPFVDHVRKNSPAERAGVRADDLVLFVNDRLAPSCKVLRAELALIDRTQEARLTIQRGQELLDVVLRAE